MKKILAYTLTSILISGLILSSSSFFDLAFAQQTISKGIMKKCEVLYSTYKKLGETKFYDVYFKKPIINDCLTLYKDPNWTFDGKSKIDMMNNDQKQEKATFETTQKGFVNAISKQNIGGNKYLVDFAICAGKNTLNDSRILVMSNKEQVIIKSKVSISPYDCETVSAEILTSNPNAIQSFLLNDNVYVPITVRTVQT